MGSEKLEVESHTYLLCLDDDLDLLYSLLKKAEKILTKEKAKYLSKLTVNLDSGIRKSIALKRSCLFHIKRESSATEESKRDDFAQIPSTSGGNQSKGGKINEPTKYQSTQAKGTSSGNLTNVGEIMKVHLTKTAADLPEPAGAILRKRAPALV